jgi:retron-type reverse transcriptase
MNDGALTPGLDSKTLDAFSTKEIEKTVNELKDHTFQFKPIRRTFIPKKNGKLRPLGIPGPTDKVVQKVIAIILEAIYDHETDPIFKESSHGFRRGRGTHTALQQISR